MQPAAAAAMDPDATMVRNIRGGMSGFMITEGSLSGKGTVNEAAFWKKKSTDVPVNEVSLWVINRKFCIDTRFFSLRDRVVVLPQVFYEQDGQRKREGKEDCETKKESK